MQPRRFARSCTLILLLLAVFPACPSTSSPQVVIHPQNSEPIHVIVEVVDTPEKRRLGLMYRNELPEFSGMLFLFPQEQLLSFWMKNTPLPLDIIYITADYTIVSIAENTTPYSEAPIPAEHLAKYALEVNGGFCQSQGIVAGDRVEFVQVASKHL